MMGTRNPTMPEEVRIAKEIRRLIIEKSEGVTGSKDEPFALDDDIEDIIREDEDAPNKTVVEDDTADAGGLCLNGPTGVARGDTSIGATSGRRGGSVTSVSPHQGVSVIVNLGFLFFVVCTNAF